MGNKQTYIEENYPTFTPEEPITATPTPVTREEKIINIFDTYQPNKIVEVKAKFKFQKSRVKYNYLDLFVKGVDTFTEVKGKIHKNNKCVNCIDYFNIDLSSYQVSIIIND